MPNCHRDKRLFGKWRHQDGNLMSRKATAVRDKIPLVPTLEWDAKGVGW